MITDKELILSNDSYIKKDFYQIYPEILELVQTISNRWNPQTSNESDPGVVLLKILAFIADKNNYNIDKAVLECFMPSATQEESMRKLCDMMGYSMTYYKSATTDVRVSYQGTALGTPSEPSGQEVKLKAFKTYFTNEDQDINYVLLDDIILTRKYEAKSARVIEGTLQTCYSNNSEDSELIKLANLDDNYRFYLPERMIAQNGIWVASSDASEPDWEQKDNLNTCIAGSKVWKFGYNSRQQLPYIEFPADIPELISDGLRIKYVRTTGTNGNIAANVLTKITSDTDANGLSLVEDDAPALIIKNESATNNGVDKETIDQAYNNFKKTVGTFDTLVSCRDYANKIYQLVSSADNTTHLVSNCQVSDIRDDINRSASIMSFNAYGISFEDVSYKKNNVDLINHFDLYVYPFAEITGSYTLDSYKNSFLPTFETLDDIEVNLSDFKTISHNIRVPEEGDICCIKNLYKLNAKITTTYKVNNIEEKAILKNIYSALYKNFNMRNVDFGEEIPYENILKVIQEADFRIKNVVLEEPDLETAFTVLTNGAGQDYKLIDHRDTYIKILSKNILAGRIYLFDYDNRFEYNFGDVPYGHDYDLIYGGGDTEENQIVKLETETKIDAPTNGSYKLRPNEIIQFVAPSLSTYLTYPAYVNYYFVYASGQTEPGQEARPAVIVKPGPFRSPRSTAELTPSDNNYTGPWYIRTATSSPSAGSIHDDTYVYIEADNTVYDATKEYVKLASTSPVEILGTAPAAQPTASNFNQTGPWYRREPSGAGAGYLNDGSFRYIKVLNYSGSYEYFKLSDVGADAIPACIKAGQEYKLGLLDILYINYTDSNGNVFNIKYTYDSVTTNGKVELKPEGVIIKPNFDLSDSSIVHQNKSWAKTTGYDSSWNILGMFSLASDEQIELRDFVRTNLKEITACYWLIGDGTIPFETDPMNPDTGFYILKEGEYFFYTDEARSSLVTLGSGTKLIRAGSDYPTTPISMSIDYTAINQIDIDEVSNKGIGAFADNPWISIPFNADDFLTIQEMQFITLAENDELIDIDNLQSTDNKISNTFAELDNATYAIYGESAESLPVMSIPGVKWQVRSRLDLNIGPKLRQELGEGQSITLYRLASGVEQIMEEITPDVGTTIRLKSNYLIQKAGGTNISTLVTYDDFSDHEVQGYPVAIMLLGSGSALYDLYAKDSGGSFVIVETNVQLPTQTYAGNYTKVNLQTQRNIRLPVVIPQISGENEEFGLIMLYYQVTDPSSADATLSTSEGELYLRRYNDYNSSGIAASYTNSIALVPGMNVIQIKESVTLKLDSLTGNGTVTLSKLSCVNDKFNTDGVDVKKLALSTDATQPLNKEFYKLLKEIKNVSVIDDVDIFYYNCDIDNSLLIDTTTDDPRVFYDYNNVYNKFTISELDADYFTAGGIALTKSSKLK